MVYFFVLQFFRILIFCVKNYFFFSHGYFSNILFTYVSHKRDTNRVSLESAHYCSKFDTILHGLIVLHNATLLVLLLLLILFDEKIQGINYYKKILFLVIHIRTKILFENCSLLLFIKRKTA